jgi:hypothetical protein
MSQRDAAVAIISMAQQARPKVRYQREDSRDQLRNFSSVVRKAPPPGTRQVTSGSL